MPQLPSGRHAGLDPAPLARAVEAARVNRRPGKLATVAAPGDVAAFIDIAWLEFPAGAGVPAQARALPGNVRRRSSGFRLRELDAFLATLDAADAAAFSAFATGPRTRAELETWYLEVLALCRELRAGVDDWDEYDLLAAFLRLDDARTRGRVPPVYDVELLEVLHGLLGTLRRHMPALEPLERAHDNSGALAAALRAEGVLPESADKDEFLHLLLGIAWRLSAEASLEGLRPAEPGAIDILALAGLGYDPGTRRHASFARFGAG